MQSSKAAEQRDDGPLQLHRVLDCLQRAQLGARGHATEWAAEWAHLLQASGVWTARVAPDEIGSCIFRLVAELLCMCLGRRAVVHQTVHVTGAKPLQYMATELSQVAQHRLC